jgi:hypothetical protein
MSDIIDLTGFVATFKDLFWSILLKAPGAKGAIKGEQVITLIYIIASKSIARETTPTFLLDRV